MFSLFKKKKQVPAPPRKRKEVFHGIKELAGRSDPDIEWFCDGSETGIHTDHVTAEHTGKGTWAECPKCGHVHARRRRLDRVTVIRTSFCRAIVPLEIVSAGMAICPVCNTNEPVFADTKEVEDLLGIEL